MVLPKLFEVAHTLNKDEWNSLGKYLLMYTREDSDNYTLYRALAKHKRELKNEGVPEKIKRKYFEHMSVKAYHNMHSRVFLWLEDWLAINSFKRKDFEKELTLIEEYNTRGKFKLANIHAQKLERKIKSSPHLSYNTNYALNRLYHSQYYSSNPIKNSGGTNLIRDCIQSFQAFSVEKNSFYYLEALNKSIIGLGDLSDLLDKLKKSNQQLDGTELSSILKKTQNVFRTNDWNDVYALKETLAGDKIKADSELYLALCVYLRKETFALASKGTPPIQGFIKEVCQMLLNAIECNPHQKISQLSFSNNVNAVSIYEDYELAKDFIDKWSSKIETKFPDSFLRYCYSINAFRNERYALIPKYMRGIEFDDFLIKILASTISIIAHYELGEEDLVYTLIKNLKKQIKRNNKKLKKLLIQRILNLLNIIIFLQKARYSSAVELDIHKHTPYHFISWVEAKIK